MTWESVQDDNYSFLCTIGTVLFASAGVVWCYVVAGVLFAGSIFFLVRSIRTA